MASHYGLFILFTRLLLLLHLGNNTTAHNTILHMHNWSPCAPERVRVNYLSHYMFPIDEGLKTTHSSRIIQWEDVLGFDGGGALIGVCLEDDDLVANRREACYLRTDVQPSMVQSSIVEFRLDWNWLILSSPVVPGRADPSAWPWHERPVGGVVVQSSPTGLQSPPLEGSYSSQHPPQPHHRTLHTGHQ